MVNMGLWWLCDNSRPHTRHRLYGHNLLAGATTSEKNGTSLLCGPTTEHKIPGFPKTTAHLGAVQLVYILLHLDLSVYMHPTVDGE